MTNTSSLDPRGGQQRGPGGGCGCRPPVRAGGGLRVQSRGGRGKLSQLSYKLSLQAVITRAGWRRAPGRSSGTGGVSGWGAGWPCSATSRRSTLRTPSRGKLSQLSNKLSLQSVNSDVDIVETARAARFFRSDGVIVTGASTGHEASPRELEAVIAGVPDTPVLVGSGVTASNLISYRLLFLEYL